MPPTQELPPPPTDLVARQKLVRFFNSLPVPSAQNQSSGQTQDTTAATKPAAEPAEPDPDEHRTRSLTPAEYQKVQDMIIWLNEHGRREEAGELARRLQAGEIRIDEDLKANAETRENIIFLNPNLFQEWPWSPTGNAKNNKITADRRFHDNVWLASILFHEAHHILDGEGNGYPVIFQNSIEINAWTAQKHWLESLLTNTNYRFTPGQIAAIQELIEDCKNMIRDYHGDPNG